MNNDLFCPVCGSRKVNSIIHYNQVPIFQNTIFSDRDLAQKCEKANIDMGICGECGLVTNSAFDENKVLYSENYDNSQEASDLFKKHLKDVEAMIINHTDLNNKKVLEVGCGKGSFLKQLVQHNNCIGMGYDPSYIGEEKLFDGRLEFKKEFYTAGDGEKYDLIVFRHVIEHLHNPLNMLRILSQGLNEDGKLYIETPYFDWIVKNNVIFDFTYEHCSYFNCKTLENLLGKVGMKILECQYNFQEQYMCIVAGYSQEEMFVDKEAISDTKKLMMEFEKHKNNRTDKIEQILRAFNEKGKVCFWGAAGKGVMCCNLFDSDKVWIDCVIDINKKKQNGYIPGTGHQIVAPDVIQERKIRTVIVVNNNYFEEIKASISRIDPTISTISLETLLREENTK